MFDKAKKSPDCAFSIVMPIDGKTVLSATPVPVEPVKKLFVNVTDLVDVPEAIKPFVAPALPRLVSVLLSYSAVYPS